MTATGEPPLCMSCSALFALKNALYSARQDAGAEDKWFQMKTKCHSSMLVGTRTEYQTHLVRFASEVERRFKLQLGVLRSLAGALF
uniref:Uncharacterized protein n=1 Tax=Timema douglasi TaxID=61478 RepID=A0A7R8ZHQ0_TIMDO|nr:unnamed protein product [Timema douglasi]